MTNLRQCKQKMLQGRLTLLKHEFKSIIHIGIKTLSKFSKTVHSLDRANIYGKTVPGPQACDQESSVAK